MESAKTPKIATFPVDGRVWRLNWIAGMRPNLDSTSDPLLDLVLERLPATFDASSPWSQARHKGEGVFTTVQVGLGALPGLTLGGLWRDGERLPTPNYPLRTLNDLRFDRHSMRLMKTGALLDDGAPRNYLIPPFIHPVHTGDALKAWCLTLTHAGESHHLIIPVMELIRFYYCASTLTARTLLTTCHPDFMDILMNMNESKYTDENSCVVAMRSGMKPGDLRLCAALLTSSHALKATRYLYESLAANLQQDGVATPKAYPPFLGKAGLVVRGIPFNSLGRTRFLVFRIESGTFPLAVRDIHTIRYELDEDTSMADRKDLPTIRHVRNKLRKSAHRSRLTPDREPDVTSKREQIIFDDRRFTDYIIVTEVVRKYSTPARKTYVRFSDRETENVATGAGTWMETNAVGIDYGDNTDLGVLETRRSRHPALPADFDTFQKILNVLSEMLGVNMRIVAGSKEYVEHELGERSLFPLHDGETTLKWSFLDKNGGERRQVLIARIDHLNGTFYLLEFQRRPNGKERFAMPLVWRDDFAKLPNELVSLEKLLKEYAMRKGGPLNKDNTLDLRERRFPHSRKTAKDFALAIKTFTETLLQA